MMNKATYVHGVRVHSNVFPQEPVECLEDVMKRPFRELTQEERAASSLIEDVINAYQEANGSEPTCVTLYGGVAIAWAEDPHAVWA